MNPVIDSLESLNRRAKSVIAGIRTERDEAIRAEDDERECILDAELNAYENVQTWIAEEKLRAHTHKEPAA